MVTACPLAMYLVVLLSEWGLKNSFPVWSTMRVEKVPVALTQSPVRVALWDVVVVVLKFVPLL